MAMTFKILRTITCGFAPDEVRAAHEFPPGTDFVRLVQDGAIRQTNLQALPADAGTQLPSCLECAA